MKCSAIPLFLGKVVGQIILQTISKCVRDKQMVGSGQYGFMIRGNLAHKVQQIKFCTWAGIAPGTTTGWAPTGWRVVWQKKMWRLGGHQVGLKPEMCPCGKGSQKCCQQIEGGYLSLLLSPVTYFWVQCLALSFPVQKRCGHTGESAAKGHKDDKQLAHVSY